MRKERHNSSAKIMEKKIGGKMLGILLLSFLVYCFTACDDNEAQEQIIPSQEELMLSGEGEAALISFAKPNWQITAISTLDKDFQIWGDIYDPNGKLIRSNAMLALDGLGKLESSWSDCGFAITRDDFNTLKVEVSENSSDTDFGFVIVLESGSEMKEITVNQSQSEGYAFEKIEYTFIPESYKKVWYPNGRFSFSNQTGHASELVKYDPFQNQYDSYTFESGDSQAFGWVKDETVDVKIPGGVWNGELFYNHETIPYSNSTTSLPLKFSVGQVAIKVPLGDSKCHFELEYEEYKAAYRVFVKNRKTGVGKIFEGTFVSSTPTGTYELVWNGDDTGREFSDIK